MKKKLLIGSVISLIIISLVAISNATTIRSAVGVTQNTLGNWGVNFNIARVSDQSGLSVGFTSGVTDWNAYFVGNPTHTFTAQYREWWGLQSQGRAGIIDFDLGGSFYIDKIALWNEDQIGIESMKVYISSNSSFATSTNVGTFSPTDNTADQNYLADIFSFTSTIGQYVRLDFIAPVNSYYDQYKTASMGEIAFSTAPVPEPTTMILLGTGLVGVAGAARRRKKNQA